MALSFPMKCKHCDARYHLSIIPSSKSHRAAWASNLLARPLLGLMYVPAALITVWLLNIFIFPLVIVLGLLMWLLTTLVIPHRLNHHDPVNRIVLRIQDKKRQAESPDTNSNP